MKTIVLFILLTILITSCNDSSSNEKTVKSCAINDITLENQESKVFYFKNKVSYDETCDFIVRKCENGILLGNDDYDKLNCDIEKAKSCSLNETVIEHNESKVFYIENTVRYNETCDFIIRKCEDGTLLGNQEYEFEICIEEEPLSCELDGIILESGEGEYFYSKNELYYGENCNNYKDFRVCNNGELTNDNSLIYSECTNSDILIKDAVLSITLAPQDTHTNTDNSGNVIQGITAYGNEWFVSQDAGNGYILFNHLDNMGNSIENWQISYDSHGQDLAWKFEDSKVTLYTGSASNQGISKYQVSWVPREITLSETIELFEDFTSITPTLNTDKTQMAIRAKSITDASIAKVFLYRLEDLNSGNINPYSEFLLSEEQISGENWFQGIVFKDEFIYCLTGDNTINGVKKLFKYSARTGEVIAKYIIDAGKEEATNDDTDGDIHYEPEGLAYKDGYLYFTINSGELGQRIKRLYKLEIF